MIEQIIVPVAIAFFTAFSTWLFARQHNKQKLESMRIENQMKSAKYYQGLLDDMAVRLDGAIDQLMTSENRNKKLTEQLMSSEERNHNLELEVKQLITVNKKLVEELQKFKQLNGKGK